MVELKVNDAEVNLVLNLLRRAMSGNMQPAMEEIGRSLKTSVQFRFREQRGPDGRAWIPSQRARREGGQTLRLSSRLRNSITYIADASSVSVGTNVAYATTHQFGRTGIERVGAHNRLISQAFGRRLRFGVYQSVRAHVRVVNIPARPFLGISSDDRQAVLDVLRDHLTRLVSEKRP